MTMRGPLSVIGVEGGAEQARLGRGLAGPLAASGLRRPCAKRAGREMRGQQGTSETWAGNGRGPKKGSFSENIFREKEYSRNF
jgi:hypothetical protein